MPFFDYEQIRDMKPGEFKVYNYLISHMESVSGMNIRQLAAATGVSTTTVLRFCEKVGCEGYTELKYRIRQELGGHKTTADYDPVPAVQFVKNSGKDEAFLHRIRAAAGIFARADLVLLYGEGESGALARYGAYLLECAGKAAFVLEYGFPAVCLSSEIQSVFLVLSVSGDSSGVLERIHRYKTMGVPVVSVTNVEQCPAARMSDVNFSCYMPKIYVGTKENGRVSQLPTVYILEMLAAEIRSAAE